MRDSFERKRAVHMQRAAMLSMENWEAKARAISPEAIARLREDRGALGRLRNEVAQLRSAVVATSLAPVSKSWPAEAPPTIEEAIVPADVWRNAGYTTPSAAVETVLWAAAGGDTDLLMRSVLLEDDARRRAAEIFAELSSDVRRRFTGAEEWVGFMTAKDVPLDGARIISARGNDMDKQTATVMLRGASGAVRQVHIGLRRTPDGWRLVMPVSAVERYAAELKDGRE